VKVVCLESNFKFELFEDTNNDSDGGSVAWVNALGLISANHT